MTTADTPGIHIIPPLLFLAALGIGFGLDAAWPVALLPDAVQYPLGAVLIAASLVVLAPTLLAFRRAATPFDVRRRAESLVTDGPNRFSRNPGYVAMIATCIGIAIMADLVWALPFLALATVILDLAVVRREERHLAARFGADYAAYRNRVRRWL